MPYCNPVLFKRSLLAVAVLSLSACSTTLPRVQDYDLSQIGEGILTAGRTTADVSQRAWDKTTYLLGFSDVEPAGNNNLVMDEVDLALLEEDAVLPGQEATPRAVVIQSAQAIPAEPSVIGQAQTDSAIEFAAAPADVLKEDASTENLLGEDPLKADVLAASNDVVAVEDLIHEVASNETLWDISKKTTGDANNWHVLADVNNLAPNASVFPGQQLIIPADMVKPGFDDVEASAPTQNTAILVDTQNLLAGAAKPATAVIEANPVVAPAEKLKIPSDSSQVLEVTQAELPEGKAFKLNAGETLWDFAKRTTGDATNWQAIAGQNNFTEKQAVVVRAGQTIYVPEDLVKTDLMEVAAADVAPAESTAVDSPIKLDPTVAATDKATSNESEAISASTELLAAASTLDETQPIKIVEANFKADETTAPIALPEAMAATPELLGGEEPVEIMVSGTYYPKAVYNDADFSSSLLMRVSPGTKLQVSKAMGSWFQVETDKGVGYVHQRDIK
ncbi:MAG: LysM peptidoglycan-binding domain-containing protein [Granulosicoccus sp.]